MGSKIKILITGATGFIGSNIVNSLSKKYDFYALVRENSDISAIKNKVYSFVYDRYAKDPFKEIASTKFQGIIHLASQAIVEHNTETIKPIIDANVLFGTHLLDFAKNNNVKWFINTGSFSQHFMGEEYNPSNLYAASKQALEVIAKYYTETSDIKFITMKLFDTFGSNDKRKKFMNLWKNLSVTGEKLKMSSGEQIIDLNHIDNIIHGYDCLINLLLEEKISSNFEYFSLSSQNRQTLKELARIFEQISGKQLNIEWGSLAYRERQIMIPSSNGKQIPGYKEKTTLRDGIKKLLTGE